MMPNKASLRESGVLVLSILVLLISFGVYYYVYVENQSSYLTQRNLRQLNTVAEKTELTITGLARAFNNRDPGEASESGFFDYVVHTTSSDTGKGMFLKSVDNEITLVYRARKGRDGVKEAGKRIDVSSLTNTGALQAVFDMVLVMDTTGTILYRSQNSLHHLTILAFDTLIADDGGAVLSSRSGRATRVSTLTIAGSKYKIFSQPLRMPASLTVTNGPWVMVGLTTVDRFRKESMKISYDVLIVFVFLIFAVSLSWPLLKLLFIGPNDELRPIEVLFIILAGFLGSSLMTLLVVNFFCFKSSLVDEMNGQLASFAATVDAHLHREIVDGIAQLDSLNRTFLFASPFRGERIANILAETSTVYLPRTYPYLEMMYLVDDTGKQVSKWSVRKSTTPLIRVQERPYFQNVLHGRMWRIRVDSSKGADFWLEPHLSLTTGGFESALAIPAKLESGKKGVVAMSTGPWSLFQTTVMQGFGYCVIDERGNVLYHSDDSRNLSENLFEECDNDRDLTSTVQTRNAGRVKVNYGGTLHTLYVMPVHDLPWSIVTFRDEEMLKSANVEVLSVSMIMFIIYAVLLFVPFAIFFFRHGWHAEWAWPVSSKKHSYLRALFLFIFMSFVLLLLRTFNAPAYHLLVVTLLLPNIAVVLTYMELQRDQPVLQWYERKRTMVNLIGSFALVSLLALTLYDYMTWFPWFTCLVVFAGGMLFLRSTRAATARENEWLPSLCLLGFGYMAVTWLSVELFPGASPATLVTAIVGATLLGFALWHGMHRFRNIPMPGFRTIYAAAGSAFLFLVAVQPSLNCFKIAFDEQMKLFVKHEQLHLVLDLEQRADRLRERYAKIPTTSGRIAQRIQDSLDVYAGFFFQTNRDTVPSVERGGAQSMMETVVLPFLMPKYDEVSTHTRFLAGRATADTLWWWNVDSTGLRLSLCKSSLIALHGVKDSVTVSSLFPGYVRQLKRISGLMWMILILTLCTLLMFLYLLVRFIMKKVFLVDASPSSCPRMFAGAGLPLARNIVFPGPVPAGLKEQLAADPSIRMIDMMEDESPDTWRRKLPASPDVCIVVYHLEHIRDDGHRTHDALVFLEELVSSLQRRVILFTAIDPLTFVPSGLPGYAPGDAKDRQYLIEADRWAILLTSFVRMRSLPSDWNARTSGQRDEKMSDNTVLKDECGDDPHLQQIALGVFERYGSGTVLHADTSCVREQFLAAARAYYSALWAACSRNERHVLISLARNGYVSPASITTVEQLMRNGLVRRQPALRLMNATFRSFVLEVQRPADMAGFDQYPQASVWRKMRSPILIAIIGALLFLFLTQREALNTTTAFLMAAAGLLPALLRLFGVFQPDGGSAAKDS